MEKDGLLLRGNRVVIPEVYQKRVLKLAHSGHMGIVKTKQLVKSMCGFEILTNKWKNWLKGVTNVKIITPLRPRSNGMCERFMRNLGKIMRNSSLTQKEWETVLVEFLRNDRDPPHASTGVTPNKLMFQYNSKTS